MEKYAEKYFQKHPILIPEIENSQICYFNVVVPVFLEEETLPVLLKSIQKAALNSPLAIELILVINYSEKASGEVKKRQKLLSKWTQSHHTSYENDKLKISFINVYDIKAKHAGVGAARKAGMDYIANRILNDREGDGIIISLDADCTIEENYFKALYRYFKEEVHLGGTLYFAHSLEGDLEPEIYEAIAEYELHLRYYLQALRYSGFPNVFHTVGSCFAVTAEAYVRAGGMPRKQAGEDFYFLQKVIPMGGFGEISGTTVFPSARPSDRVPFGTGPSVQKLMDEEEEYYTYNLQAFIDLKEFLDKKELLYHIKDDEIEEFVHRFGGRMRSYLINSDFFEALKPINQNCTSLKSFNKRFYEVFNSFRVVKYLNYTHEHFLEKVPVFDAALQLAGINWPEAEDLFETQELLLFYRQLEKK